MLTNMRLFEMSLQAELLQKCVDYLRDEAPYVLEPDWVPQIFRGTKRKAPCWFQDPAAFPAPRQSKNTTNETTLLVSSSAGWLGYPRREVICSTDWKRASEYARSKFGIVYVVVPPAGASIGVCPDVDFHCSFPNMGAYDTAPGNTWAVSDFNLTLLYMYRYTKNRKLTFSHDEPIIGLDQRSGYELREQLKEIDDRMAADPTFKGDMAEAMRNASMGTKVFEEWYASRMPLLAWIDEVGIDPAGNGFAVAKPADKLPPEREVWTDARCMFATSHCIQEARKLLTGVQQAEEAPTGNDDN